MSLKGIYSSSPSPGGLPFPVASPTPESTNVLSLGLASVGQLRDSPTSPSRIQFQGWGWLQADIGSSLLCSFWQMCLSEGLGLSLFPAS